MRTGSFGILPVVTTTIVGMVFTLAGCGLGDAADGPTQPELDANGVLNLDPIRLMVSPDDDQSGQNALNHLTGNTAQATAIKGSYTYQPSETKILSLALVSNSSQNCATEVTPVFSFKPTDQIATAVRTLDSDTTVTAHAGRKYTLEVSVLNAGQCSTIDFSFIISPAN